MVFVVVSPFEGILHSWEVQGNTADVGKCFERGEDE